MNRKPLPCACLRVTLPVVSGSLRMLIAARGRLPEDQSLHYQAQVLQALEYLAKKKVAHLDIKGKTFFFKKAGERKRKTGTVSNGIQVLLTRSLPDLPENETRECLFLDVFTINFIYSCHFSYISSTQTTTALADLFNCSDQSQPRCWN